MPCTRPAANLDFKEGNKSLKVYVELYVGKIFIVLEYVVKRRELNLSIAQDYAISAYADLCRAALGGRIIVQLRRR